MWYWNIATLVFVYWLSLFLLDRETPKNHLLSWVVLIVASLLWPLTVPRAIMELASKVESDNQKDEVESDNQQNQSSQVSSYSD